MKSFVIAWNDFMIRFKDRRGFMLMILMPLLLTLILGSALGGVMGEGSSTFPKTKLGIVLPDNDPLAKQYINEILKSKELKPYIKIKHMDSKDSLAKAIRKETVDAGLVFPMGWSAELNSGKIKKLDILADPAKPLQANILQSVSQTFVQRVQTVAVSTKTVLSMPVSSGNADMAALSQSVVNELKTAAETQLKAVQEKSVGKKPVSGMQYYAAAMACMFLLFNISVGAKLFINERNIQTLSRLMSTPTGKTSILTGKFLGTLYYAAAQFVIFMLATRYIFGVHWGDNMLQTIAVGLSFAIAVSGLSMLIASVIKNEKSADLVGGIGVQIFAVLGGSMIPITIFPNMLRNFAHIVPNTWALTSFVDIMGGTDWGSLILPITVLASIGIIATLLGTWRVQAR